MHQHQSVQSVFPIVDLRYVFIRFKAGKMPSLSAFVACESKTNLTIVPTSLMSKLLFRDISTFLTMVFITTALLPLNTNKFGNNFNCHSNLLMPMILVLLSKKVLFCNWLATDKTFWYRQELEMWISGAFFVEKGYHFDNLAHVAFRTKGKLFYKTLLKRSVLRSKFQNLSNLDEKN